MLQIVRQTWQERYDMYMSLEKEQLAAILAEQSKYMFPDSCVECTPLPVDTRYYTTSTYTIK